MEDRERGLRFLLVGVWNTLFGLASFALLNIVFGGQVSYMVLLVVAWCINILQNYITNRYFVFKVEGHWWRDFARFSVVYAGTFAFNLAALPFGVSILGLSVILCQVIVTVVVVLFSFVAHGRFSFRRPASDAIDPA